MPGTVTYMASHKKIRNPKRDAQLRRVAIQLAAQLPEDTEEALEVLEHTKTLVWSFLGDDSKRG